MKLLLVEDHLFIAESLQLLMQDSTEMMVATNCNQAIQIIRENEPFDIILLDMGLPDHDGLSLLSFLQMHEYFPPVLVITGKENQSDMISTVKSLGASGFYHKSQSPKILLEAIDSLLAGGHYWPLDVIQETADPEYNHHNLASHFGITPRQLEVLHYLEDGLQNKQIADLMNISEATVKTHVKALYAALGARTRGGCVKTARQLGLL